MIRLKHYLRMDGVRMMMARSRILVLIMAVLSPLASAEQTVVFGDYTVHYNAFTTDNLSPSVAKNYNIPRSKKSALVNIAVLKNPPASTPVEAKITGTVINLNQQLRQLDFRQVVEQDAIYYIAETPIHHQETLKYELAITLGGRASPHHFSFQKQFYK